MKVLLEFEITNCNECPFLTNGRTFGNDGRDGSFVHICSKGAFGKKKDEREYGYSSGLSRVPEVIPENCPLKSMELRSPCEECDPMNNPVCTKECQDVCPKCKNYRGDNNE